MLAVLVVALATQAPPAEATPGTVQNIVAGPVSRVLEDNSLVVSHAFVFPPGSATLSPESDAAVKAFAAVLTSRYSYVSTARVEGHVSADAQALSEARALAVAKALEVKGVDGARLLPVGFGDSKPRYEKASPESNTRIAIVFAALRGKAIGGMPTDGGGRAIDAPCPRTAPKKAAHSDTNAPAVPSKASGW